METPVFLCSLLSQPRAKIACELRTMIRRSLSTSSDNSSRSKFGKKGKKDPDGRDIVYNSKHMMNVISSTQSLTAKKVHALLRHRHKREKNNQVVVEGPRMVLDLYRNLQTRKYMEKVLIDIDLFEKYAKIFKQLHEQNPDKEVDGKYPARVGFYPAYKDIFKVCCSDTVTHQGIIAVCEMPHPIKSKLKKRTNTTDTDDDNEEEDLSSPQEHRMYLVCDAVQDPGNMGTLIRSAVACGVSAVYLLPNACDVWNPKAIRAAMGATFVLPIIQTDSWEDCYRQLQIVGCTPSSIYAATMLDNTKDENEFNFENWDNRTDTEEEGELTSIPRPSKAYYDVDWIGRTSSSSSRNATLVAASALIIGNEGNGLTMPLRNSILDQQLQTIHVPMMNQDSAAPTSVVESLNAAVCGSIILFDYLRQKQLHLKTLE
jgi:tRNA G18 (ribose-2'-O)-methylase SpoU